MKISEEVKERLVWNLRRWQEKLCDVIDFYIDKIEGSKTVEDVMRYKKKLLEEVVDRLPFGLHLCYFCIAMGRGIFHSCCKCPYGKIHGVCYLDGSDYSEIVKAKKQLLELISRWYYGGESYDEQMESQGGEEDERDRQSFSGEGRGDSQRGWMEVGR